VVSALLGVERDVELRVEAMREDPDHARLPLLAERLEAPAVRLEVERERRPAWPRISRFRPLLRPSFVRTLPPFEHVVDEHGPAVLRFCAAQVGRDRAEDCFQETMLSALRAYDQVRDPGAIRSWLFSIASRKAVDAHRARARGPEPRAEVEPLPIMDEPDLSDGSLWQRVQGLPPKQRQAVSLRYVADLSHREIAVVMQTSEAAARRNVYEALVHLRAHVEP
jgi:RNA polymerase sigma factor (sigma-70 family)